MPVNQILTFMLTFYNYKKIQNSWPTQSVVKWRFCLLYSILTICIYSSSKHFLNHHRYGWLLQFIEPYYNIQRKTSDYFYFRTSKSNSSIFLYTLCFFQVFDGLQATFGGIFRGLKHTEVIMIGNFISFWLIAIPLGTLLALHYKLYLMGFWYALIVAAIVLCSFMYSRLLKHFKELNI